MNAMSDTPHPFSHWMLHEIHEQPATLAATLDRYADARNFRDDAVAPLRQWLSSAQSGILIAASGSSRHAGMVAELLLEDAAAIPVDVEYASEYIYRPDAACPSAVLVVSQSGETADTLAALRKANRAGHPTLAITNDPHSSMAREATVSFPTLAGRERAVPATKSFTAQLLNLHLLALLAAEARNTLTPDALRLALEAAATLPDGLAAQLPGWERSVRELIPAFASAASFLFLGRGPHYPIAREGALKLKESAYLHAEGYPSGELKHGPNALVDSRTPLVMLATVDPSSQESVARYEKVLQLLRDMRSQGATILALATTGDTEVPRLANHTLFIDPAPEPLLVIAETIPLQLFAYCMAIHLGIDVDHPRNLTKAVLAE